MTENEKKKRGRPSLKDKVAKTLTKSELSQDYIKERLGKEALQENKVLLWGLHKIKSSLLEPYEKEYKPPKSFKISKISKTSKTKPENLKRIFNSDDEYTYEDLDFLNSEYERITNILENDNTLPKAEYSDYEDKQEQLVELIEGLEALKEMSKKLSGGRIFESNGIKQSNQDEIESDIDGSEDYEDIEGNGIKRMVRGKAIKEQKPKQPTKARVVKGSEEALEIGRRLAEAKRVKKLALAPKEEPIKKEPIKKKVKKDPRHPYYYIGEIPAGYREATEEEAILNNQVSYWGKYKVEYLKYHTYNILGVMYVENLDPITVLPRIMGMKRRIQKLLKDEEIYKNKIESTKHKDKGAYKVALLEIQDQLQYSKILYEHYLKVYAIQKDIEYKKPIYKIEYRYTPSQEAEPKLKVEPTPKIKVEEKKEVKKEKNKYMFKSDDNLDLILTDKHFDKDFNLTEKTAKKLYDKNIRLLPDFYTKQDVDKYFYSKHSNIKGGAIFKPIGGMIDDIVNIVKKPFINNTEFKDFPSSVQNVVKELGNKPIQQIKITRTVLPPVINMLLNGLSMGQFEENKQKLGYDKLYHIRIDMMVNNKWLIIEKNEMLHSTTDDTRVPQNSTQKDVTNIPPNLTLIDMLRNVKKYMGSNLLSYSAQHNNCQDFALSFLKASKVGNKEDYDFIKQNTEELFNKMSNISKIADKSIELVAGLKHNVLGDGIGPVHNSNIQSVLFDKNIFTLSQSKHWLKQRNFKQDVDNKSKHFRFRQFKPKPSDHYVTKQITDGIQIILKVDKPIHL